MVIVAVVRMRVVVIIRYFFRWTPWDGPSRWECRPGWVISWKRSRRTVKGYVSSTLIRGWLSLPSRFHLISMTKNPTKVVQNNGVDWFNLLGIVVRKRNSTLPYWTRLLSKSSRRRTMRSAKRFWILPWNKMLMAPSSLPWASRCREY